MCRDRKRPPPVVSRMNLIMADEAVQNIFRSVKASGAWRKKPVSLISRLVRRLETITAAADFAADFAAAALRKQRRRKMPFCARTPAERFTATS